MDLHQVISENLNRFSFVKNSKNNLKMTEQKFSDKKDYKETLEELKTGFFKNYEKQEPSGNDMKDFKISIVLGQGAFGVVKLVTHEPTGKFYALKILKKDMIIKKKQLEHTMNEKRILKSMEYPFVVTMEFSFKDNNYLYFVLPFVNGGELFNHLRNVDKFKEPQAKFYAAQVFLALEYLHYMDMVHRDLKPENILMDCYGFVKLNDFGFCKIVNNRTYTFCGTPEYIAPEIIQIKGYGKSVDWWSYGVLLYEFVAGYSPFFAGSPDQHAMLERIVAGKYKIPKYFSDDLKNLIRNLLQTDLSRRYGNLKNGISDIKNHPWFSDINWVQLLNKEIKVPFVPKLTGPGDTSQFDPTDDVPLMFTDTCQYENEFADF